MEQEKPVELEEAEKKIGKASETLSYLCDETWAGRLKDAWHWEIPANPERDTDLILGDAIRIAAQSIKEIRSLRAENARLKGQVIPVRFRVTIGEHNAEIEVSPSASPKYHQGMVTIAIKEVLRRANAKWQAEAVSKVVDASRHALTAWNDPKIEMQSAMEKLCAALVSFDTTQGSPNA